MPNQSTNLVSWIPLLGPLLEERAALRTRIAELEAEKAALQAAHTTALEELHIQIRGLARVAEASGEALLRAAGPSPSAPEPAAVPQERGGG